MSSLSEFDVRRLLRKYSVKPRKKRGQTFLTDPLVARRIVKQARLDRSDSVLEVGGGLGALTCNLARAAGHVYVIEIDRRLVTALRDIVQPYSNVTIIEGDALRVKLPKTDKVVSNLPYSISSEITFRLLRECEFQVAILMYQKEFAARLTAEPCTSEYSRLTVNVSYEGVFEPLFEVPATAFYPQPSVDSVVLRARRRTDGPRARDNIVFSWMVRGLYSYPNKQIRKALKIWLRQIGADADLCNEVLRRAGTVNETDRLRCLTIEQIVLLSDAVCDLIDMGIMKAPAD